MLFYSVQLHIDTLRRIDSVHMSMAKYIEIHSLKVLYRCTIRITHCHRTIPWPSAHSFRYLLIESGNLIRRSELIIKLKTYSSFYSKKRSNTFYIPREHTERLPTLADRVHRTVVLYPAIVELVLKWKLCTMF